MERAEIFVGSRRIESIRELLIGVEHGRLELPLGADDPTPNWTDLLSDLLSHEQVDSSTHAITGN